MRSPEYWFQDAQLDLYTQVNDYLKREGINQTELAERLNVTKGYISQILNGNFNYTLKKLIDLSLAIGIVPKIKYSKIEDVIKADTERKMGVKHEMEVVHFQSYKSPISLVNHMNKQLKSPHTVVLLSPFPTKVA